MSDYIDKLLKKAVELYRACDGAYVMDVVTAMACVGIPEDVASTKTYKDKAERIMTGYEERWGKRDR